MDSDVPKFSHLLCWFCATSGQNGELLGSDETGIIMISYVLIDLAKGKVVSVQHHYVRPHTRDTSEEPLISAECRQLTNIPPEALNNAHSLENVLLEMDRFLSSRGVHPDHSGKNFCIVTEGELHLRQALHPEAIRRKITLPNYFYSFYNLKSQFKNFYRCQTATDNVKSYAEHLGLSLDMSAEYGIRQVQDMASILLRMFKDGFEPSTPETINTILQSGICSREELVPDNVVVRARGLPWQATDTDIDMFFRGLNIAQGGVALCLSSVGRRNGEALVRFVNAAQRDMALARHKHHIRERYIEVYRATGKDFVKIAGGCNHEALTFLKRGGDTIVRMRGLPFTATKADVLNFFVQAEDPPYVLNDEDGILFVKYHDGRATGDAFVAFGSAEEESKALTFHRKVMGSRYIELFRSTTAEVQQVLNRSLDPSIKPPGEMKIEAEAKRQQPVVIPQLQRSLVTSPLSMVTGSPQRDCLRLAGLPTEADTTTVTKFLGDFAAFIRIQGVHLIVDNNGKPVGEVLVQMISEQAAQQACVLKQNCALIMGDKQYIIEVQQLSGMDLGLRLGAEYSHPSFNNMNSLSALQTAVIPRPFLVATSTLPKVPYPISSPQSISPSNSESPLAPLAPISASIPQCHTLLPSHSQAAPANFVNLPQSTVLNPAAILNTTQLSPYSTVNIPSITTPSIQASLSQHNQISLQLNAKNQLSEIPCLAGTFPYFGGNIASSPPLIQGTNSASFFQHMYYVYPTYPRFAAC